MAEDSPEVLGQYAIYERLGRGGMATVNRAEMRGLAGFRKPVALKRLHRHVAEDPKMVEMFVHEARLASHLHHPNIAQTYDLGKVDKTYFIAMEYVPGPTLTQILKQAAVAAGPVPVPIALAILAQICEALDYAHNLCDEHGKPLGIIHRDVSPANIIVSNTGVVKLIDFGIAKATTSDKTKSGTLKGKFAYMAPEYVSGGQLDLRADLFGLGVIAHELLTGRRLFHARNDFDTIVKLRELTIQPPSRWNPDVPRDLDDIVLTALQRSPELRWQSASAMRTAITNAMEAFGPRVTNQQVLEWVDWAFKQQPKQEDSGLVRVIDSLDDSSAVSPDYGPDPAEGFAGDPAPGAGAGPRRPSPGSEPRTKAERVSSKEARIRTTKTPKPRPRPGAAARPRGSRRVWLLLLLLLALAVLVRDEIMVSGRALYDWYVG